MSTDSTGAQVPENNGADDSDDTVSDTSDFLMGSGCRAAFVEEDGVGSKVTGVVVAKRKRQQRDYDTNELVFWPDTGKPKMQMLVDLQTELCVDDEDDGLRRLYLKGGDLQQQIRVAVRKVRAKDLELGGTLTVERVGKGVAARTADGKKKKPPWLHRVEYVAPPAVVTPTDDPWGSKAAGDTTYVTTDGDTPPF